jgi:hypothetical protein
MAPATYAGATEDRPVTGRGGWTRENVIDAIREWVDAYGEPPRAADWNPSSAKWTGQQWRVERYRAGRSDGSPWPALNTAKRPFGGSLNAAVRAAGYEPARPGPRRRGSVDPAQADRAVISPEGRAMLEAALAQAREAEKRVAVLEARLERSRNRKKSRTHNVARPHVVRVVDEAAVARAERRAAAAEVKAATTAGAAKAAAAELRGDLIAARADARRLATRLERAETTVSALRAERRELVADTRATAERLRATERELDGARAEARAALAEAEASQALRAVASSPEALAEAAAARRAARVAEQRAATAERELREAVAAITGEPRRLTSDELASLRAAGPSGPSVLAASLKALAKARATGSPTSLTSALLDVASAAITWRERI